MKKVDNLGHYIIINFVVCTSLTAMRARAIEEVTVS
jgi:hypothetical protein